MTCQRSELFTREVASEFAINCNTTRPKRATRMLWGCEALPFEKTLVRQFILEVKRSSDSKTAVFTRVKACHMEQNKLILLVPEGRFRTMDRRWNGTEN